MSIIYRHHQPAFFHRRPPSSAHPVFFLGLFLKNMFFLATAWFAASIAIRIVVLTLSILFSPPVFVLLLLTFATSWWSFDALRHNEQRSSFPTATSTAPFGAGRCSQSPCSRGARQRRREFCHRFQQQCQSKCQQEQSHEAKASSTSTEDGKSEESTDNATERLNNFQQPKPKRVFYQRAPFHIEQDDQHVTLSIDVAGYSVSDLNITVDQDGTLAIAGERKNKIGDAFSFQRQFVVSPKRMDTTTVTADVVDGLLIVTIAKKEIPKPRLITISTSTPEAQETDRDETEGPREDEEVEEETIVFENTPVEEEDLLLSTKKKPIEVETINDEDEDDQVDESDPVEEGDDHDSWEDVIKA